ncbi:hypothetical protein AB0B30_36850 [Streptomyces narbonensis]|uniref:BON domain-containing protein n=1 Tax=Streptomyces narbonensis TaxID=67333 RepID=A0ABV3CL78_9ACTN
MNTDEREYRIARFRDRLARGEAAELGVRVEMRGTSVMLKGTLLSADRRDEVLRIAASELAGIPLHTDLLIACADPPERPEELS